MTGLLAVMVVTVVAVVVAYPLWKPGPQAPPDPVGPAATLAALEEHKLQLYAAIRELGFDYRTDKLEEADYEEEVDRVKAEAIEVVRKIDELKKAPPRGPDELEAEIEAFRRQILSAGDEAGGFAAAFCTQCGTPAGEEDLFCASCGAALKAS